MALSFYTGSALTIMRLLRVGRKVRCHRAIVEMFTTVNLPWSPFCLLVNECNRDASTPGTSSFSGHEERRTKLP